MPLVMLVSLPVLLVFTVLALSVVVQPPASRFLESRLRSKLRAQGRWLSRDTLDLKLQGNIGTLIVEYPSIGWPVLRVWWTPDKVPVVVGPEPDMEAFEAATREISTTDRTPVLPEIVAAVEWTTSCMQRYTALGSGQALAVNPPSWKRHERWLDRIRQAYPGTTIVSVSAHVVMWGDCFAQCQACRYPLTNLPLADGQVLCPECGLKQRGPAMP
jgi:hypothetical protein